MEAAQPNYLRRNADYSTDDPLLDEQWGLEAIGWRSRDPGSAEGVLIAVVDSGIDAGHPDLRDRVWRNPAEVLGEPGVDDDDNGYVDDLAGWDFTDAPGLPGSGDYLERDADPADDSGHGTHVAGVAAAAAGNGEGIAGVAPGVRVMALRAGLVIEGTGYLQDDDIAAAMVYATENGADVINLSLGDPAYSPLLDDVVRFALSRGVVVVAAAGNESGSEVFYPARLQGDHRRRRRRAGRPRRPVLQLRAEHRPGGARGGGQQHPGPEAGTALCPAPPWRLPTSPEPRRWSSPAIRGTRRCRFSASSPGPRGTWGPPPDGTRPRATVCCRSPRARSTRPRPSPSAPRRSIRPCGRPRSRWSSRWRAPPAWSWWWSGGPGTARTAGTR